MISVIRPSRTRSTAMANGTEVPGPTGYVAAADWPFALVGSMRNLPT